MEIPQVVIGGVGTAFTALGIWCRLLWTQGNADTKRHEDTLERLNLEHTKEIAEMNGALMSLAEARRADLERAGIAIAHGVQALQEVTAQLVRLARTTDQPARLPGEERRR